MYDVVYHTIYYTMYYAMYYTIVTCENLASREVRGTENLRRSSAVACSPDPGLVPALAAAAPRVFLYQI